VIEEANAITVAAVRGLRTRNREEPGLISSRRTSLLGGQTGPFADTTTTVTGRAMPSKLALGLFTAFWIALLIACLLYLWRTMRPRIQITNAQAPMTNQ